MVANVHGGKGDSQITLRCTMAAGVYSTHDVATGKTYQERN
jgi:hypothetical protein